jgi:glucose/arabinose dehydrogenase
MTKSQNNEIYFVIGDLSQSGTFQNIPNKIIYETSSIFKVVTESNNSVELYAMGIRNSFGLAVDPVTGYLWDTENSTNNYDEINLVKPGFNSGWKRVMGPVDRDNPDIDGPQTIPPPFENFVYSDPEFSFYHAVGLTAIEFPDKGSFEKYSDWLFVGDYNNGRIYKFQLNSDRTGFVFSNPELSDLVLDDNDEIDEILFAKGFQTVTDIEFHDDAMYVVSISDGSIYKIYEPTQSELANKIAQDTILTLILVGTAIAVTLGVTMGVIRRKRMRS